jgi:leishmanolysin
MEVYSSLMHMLKVIYHYDESHSQLCLSSAGCLILCHHLTLSISQIAVGIANADLVLLVTTRPTTGNTLAWAVACERDQWGRAIAGLPTPATCIQASKCGGVLFGPNILISFAGHVNVAPRHLTAEAETLLSATLIHEVLHVLGFDPHAFTHFRDERKRRRSQVLNYVFLSLWII